MPTGAVAELKYEKIGHFFKALAGNDTSTFLVRPARHRFAESRR